MCVGWRHGAGRHGRLHLLLGLDVDGDLVQGGQLRQRDGGRAGTGLGLHTP